MPKKHQLVLGQVLPNLNMKRRFSQCLSAFDVGSDYGSGKRRKQDSIGGVALVAGSMASAERRQRVRGYDVFVSQSFAAEAGGTMKRSTDARKRWSLLSDEAKSEYNSRAVAENRVLEEVQRMDFNEFCQSDWAQSLRKGMRTRVRRTCVLRTLEKLHNHSSWKAGANVDGYEGGLRIVKVLPQTRAEASQRVKSSMEYDPRPAPNPAVPNLKPFSVCSFRHGGLCSRGRWQRACTFATKNMYNACANMIGDAKKRNAKFPILLEFRIETDVEDQPIKLLCFLAKTVGVGDMAITVRMLGFIDGAVEKARLTPEDDRIVSTSHLMFKRMMVAAGIDPGDVHHISMSWLGFRRDEHATWFQIIIDRTGAIHVELSCVRDDAKMKVTAGKKVKSFKIFGVNVDAMPDPDSGPTADAKGPGPGTSGMDHLDDDDAKAMVERDADEDAVSGADADPDEEGVDDPDASDASLRAEVPGTPREPLPAAGGWSGAGGDGGALPDGAGGDGGALPDGAEDGQGEQMPQLGCSDPLGRGTGQAIALTARWTLVYMCYRCGRLRGGLCRFSLPLSRVHLFVLHAAFGAD